MPVIEAGRLVGLVSRANLVHALASALTASATAAPLSDDTIRERILAEIDRQPWGPRASVSVAVENGVVAFYGSILDEREREALHVVAENIPGVRAVHDHLAWIEPVSGTVVTGADPNL